MTRIDIIAMVKCPMLIEHEPCDLVPSTDCYNCNYKVFAFSNTVECSYEEV